MKVSQFFAEMIESTATDITTPDDTRNTTIVIRSRRTSSCDLSNIGPLALLNAQRIFQIRQAPEMMKHEVKSTTLNKRILVKIANLPNWWNHK